MAGGERPLELVVVDDCPTVREALSLILDAEGFRVRAFGTAEEFLAAAPEITAECVLLDVGLPARSGLDVLRTIRRAGYAAPVIVISGLADPSLPEAASQAGAWSFIEKPFDADIVLDHVRRALGARG